MVSAYLNRLLFTLNERPRHEASLADPITVKESHFADGRSWIDDQESWQDCVDHPNQVMIYQNAKYALNIVFIPPLASVAKDTVASSPDSGPITSGEMTVVV